MMLSKAKQEVIRVLADCDMNLSEAARVLRCSRNNVIQHANRIQEITGLDPRCFYDLIELLEVVREVENA